MKKYKCKLKYDVTEALEKLLINALATIYPGDDSDRLLLAALAEIKIRLSSKLVEYKPKYSFSFSPVQAIALRMLYEETFSITDTGHLANKLLQLANEIHQHYS